MTERLDILVVEDTPKHQESAKVLLRDHEVRLVRDYSEAVKELNRRSPQVLLTDLNFPFGDNCPSQDCDSPRPLGFSLAFYAARSRIAVPRIAIYTDTNHHSDGVSATFDTSFYCNYSERGSSEEVFVVGGHFTRPLFRLGSSILGVFDVDYIGDRGEPKDWKTVLDTILQEPVRRSAIKEDAY